MGFHLKEPVDAGSHGESVGARSNFTLKRNEQLVYDALRRSRLPLKAYDLLDQLQCDGLKAPMTIYRALEALISKDCVKKIESLNAFVAVDSSESSIAHAFLICRKCMRVKELNLDSDQLEGLFTPFNIPIEDIRIEAFGDCDEVCKG